MQEATARLAAAEDISVDVAVAAILPQFGDKIRPSHQWEALSCCHLAQLAVKTIQLVHFWRFSTSTYPAILGLTHNI